MSPALRFDGWPRYNLWDHSASVAELYRRRVRRETEEMTCYAQAAELLAPLVRPGDGVLDAGCGSGAFYHSLAARGLPVEYHGVDATAALIAIGREELPAFGLPAENLHTARIEDLDGAVDHVVCLNVLTNIDNYHRPLERLLRMAGRSLILRESIKDGADYAYVRDVYLDEGADLRVHVNTYDRRDITRFVESYGFAVEEHVDRRCGGKPEMVIDYPHYWTFLVATRTGA